MRPEIVLVGAVGLALKDHGRDRTVNGLGARDPRLALALAPRAWSRAIKTLQRLL